MKFSKYWAKADDEEMEEGWGESSAGLVRLKVEDGKIYFSDHEWTGADYKEVWHPLPEVKEKKK